MNEMKKNLPASIHQRLLNIAREENRPLNELLQYFAIERFLYRLGESKHRNQFILKGGQMLKVWNLTIYRPTKDIDPLGRTDNDPNNLESIVRDCCLMKIADGVEFDSDSIVSEPIKKDAKYKGTRILLKGSLGKIKLSVQIDFGFGDVVVPTPIEIKLPELLDFGKPDLIGYSVESVIAEKFQAMVELDLTNTRMKDFFDIWMLSKNIDFNEEILHKAIKETFRNRKTEIPTDIPNALTADFRSG